MKTEIVRPARRQSYSPGPLERHGIRGTWETTVFWKFLNLGWKWRAIVDFAAPVLHHEAPDLAGVHSGKAATDGSAGAGSIASRRLKFGAYRREDGRTGDKMIVE